MAAIRFVKIQGKYYSIMSSNSPENVRSGGNNNNNNHNNNNNNGCSNRPVNSVRRCLFGKRSFAEKQKESILVKSYLGSIAQQKTLKYNFDFENQRPLAGNYQWFEVPSVKSTQSTTSRSIHNKHLLRVPVTPRVDFRHFYSEGGEDEIENRLGDEGKTTYRGSSNEEGLNDKWSPLSCTTSKYNINNNHHNPFPPRCKKKVITDYFSKDLAERPSSHTTLLPPNSPSHVPSSDKRASEKRKKVIQDYFPIKKMKARN